MELTERGRRHIAEHEARAVPHFKAVEVELSVALQPQETLLRRYEVAIFALEQKVTTVKAT